MHTTNNQEKKQGYNEVFSDNGTKQEKAVCSTEIPTPRAKSGPSVAGFVYTTTSGMLKVNQISRSRRTSTVPLQISQFERSIQFQKKNCLAQFFSSTVQPPYTTATDKITSTCGKQVKQLQENPAAIRIKFLFLFNFL